MKKIEDKSFLDHDFLFRTLEFADAAPLPERGDNRPYQGGDKQPGKKKKT